MPLSRHTRVFLVPMLVAIGVCILVLGDFIPTKLKGLIFAVLGFWFAWATGGNSVEGPYLAFFGAWVGTAGLYYYGEGLKREIIDGVREVSGETNEVEERE